MNKFEQIEQYIVNCRQQIDNGDLVDLSDLMPMVEELCLEARNSEDPAMQEKLHKLENDIADIGLLIASKLQEMQGEFMQINQQKKANHAYSKSNLTAEISDISRKED